MTGASVGAASVGGAAVGAGGPVGAIAAVGAGRVAVAAGLGAAIACVAVDAGAAAVFSARAEGVAVFAAPLVPPHAAANIASASNSAAMRGRFAISERYISGRDSGTAPCDTTPA